MHLCVFDVPAKFWNTMLMLNSLIKMYWSSWWWKTSGS